MNTPTKITFSRIIAIVLMMIALFVLSLIPGLVTPNYNFGIENGWTGINIVYIILFVFFLIAS